MADYIDKKRFYDLFVDHREKYLEAEKEGKPHPEASREIALNFIMLAHGIASRRNFSGYTYKDEMIDDGIENCVAAVNNFDPEKSKNPYGYFTQVIWWAFLRRIEKENKQQYIKYKSLEKAKLENNLVGGDSEFFQDDQVQIYHESLQNTIDKFEKKKK